MPRPRRRDGDDLCRRCPSESATTAVGESPPDGARRTLSRRARHAVLTAHIVMSVGLLGDSAGYLAVAVRTRTIDDPVLAHDSVKTLNMFSLIFGIPLSIGALLTGLALGIGTRWGVFRYPWVVAKLGLIISSSWSAPSSSRRPVVTCSRVAKTRRPVDRCGGLRRLRADVGRSAERFQAGKAATPPVPRSSLTFGGRRGITSHSQPATRRQRYRTGGAAPAPAERFGAARLRYSER